MKRVQDALRPTGIPVFAGILSPADGQPELPGQYLVYSSMTVEDEHWDDAPARYKTFVYLNLWSASDITDAIFKVRRAMRAAGFVMEEETDRGYNRPSYSTEASLFTMAWTWVCWTNVVTEEAITDGV